MGAGAAETVAWLTTPYRMFGERLGGVLYRVPERVIRDDERLRALLGAWPADMPLAVEFQHASWQADAVFDLLREHGAALCATDLDGADLPDLRLTGPFLYVRLRRSAYAEDELAAWAERLAAFVGAGTDCFVFLRHDDDGESALRAERLATMVEERLR